MFRDWSLFTCIPTLQVQYSQRMNDSPLSCWIVTEASGEVCSAHCNYMPGLGETCTHAGAVLFYMEAAARLQGNQTSTQRKCEWIMPSFQTNVQYLPIKDIDFTSARAKKGNLIM